MGTKEQNKLWRRKWREKIITGYGGKCTCCGETTYEFLAIHHTKNNGSEERSTGLKGSKFLKYIEDANYPDDYSILCHNCNSSIEFNGYCSHKGRQYAKSKDKAVNWREDIRRQVIEHYGSFCACCGETTIEFLSLNHINKDGNEHRRKISGVNRFTIYKWTIDNDYPNTLDIRCYNCNLSDGYYGICPHNNGASKNILNLGSPPKPNRLLDKLKEKISNNIKFNKYIEIIEKIHAENDSVLKSLLKFFDLIKEEEDCWIWCGKTEKDGSIRIFTNGRHISVRRFSYFVFVDDFLQKNAAMRSICKNPCVKPEHLEIRVIEGINSISNELLPSTPRRPICKYGHPFTEENTRIFNGKHICKICSRENRY